MFLDLRGSIPQPMHQGSGGGGNWIGGLVGGIAAGAGVRGANRQYNSMNKYYGQMYSPETINAYARGFNPWVWNAIEGQKGSTGFEGDLYNIAQGKDISPWLLNNPLATLNRGASQNLTRFQSLVGRNDSGGGMSNFAALANLATLGGQKANLMNQYGQWREQQRRSDIDWLLGQIGSSQNKGNQAASNIAQSHQFRKNFLQKLSAFGAGYASGSGGSSQYPQQPTANVPEYHPYTQAGNQDYGQTTQWYNINPGGNYGQGSAWGYNGVQVPR